MFWGCLAVRKIFCLTLFFIGRKLKIRGGESLFFIFNKNMGVKWKFFKGIIFSVRSIVSLVLFLLGFLGGMQFNEYYNDKYYYINYNEVDDKIIENQGLIKENQGLIRELLDVEKANNLLLKEIILGPGIKK
jgi:hypothetical protein